MNPLSFRMFRLYLTETYIEMAKGMNNLLGGVSACIAVGITHPIDTLKVKYQVANELTGVKPNILDIIKHTHPKQYYNGLSTAFLKQGTYTTIRFSVFNTLRKDFGDVGGAICAGAVGSFITTPVDQMMIRQQAVHGGGGGMMGAFYGIVRQRGMIGLWDGGVVQTIRASCVTTGQLPMFFYLQRTYPEWVNGSIWGHLGAGLIAGTSAALLAAPFDILKSRLMSAKVRGSNYEYQGGLIKSMYHTMKKDGWKVFGRGVTLTWLRLGPQSTIMLTVLSQLQTFFHITKE